MEKQTLRAQDAAKYWGCRVKRTFNNPSETPRYGAMVGLGFDCIDVHLDGWQSISSTKLENCQLVLTPLDRISDEDALEVSRVYGHNVPSAELGRGLVQKYFYTYLEYDEVTLQDGVKVGDWLRSKAYDIDGLIESGKAVESER